MTRKSVSRPWSVMKVPPRANASVAVVALVLVAAALTASPPAGAEKGRAGRTITSASRGFLPGAAGARLFEGKDAEQVSEEMVVRMLYSALQETTIASGKPVAFELDGFTTLYPADFSRFRWADLVTQQGGQRVKIERVESHDGRGPLGISYEPSWTTVASEQSPELGHMVHRRPINELFAELAAKDESLRNVLALTGFRVTVSFEGASRSYKAAVLWLDPDRDGRVTLAVQDNVTDRVDQAVTEKLRVVPRSVLEAAASAKEDKGPQSATAATTICKPHSQTYSFPLAASDTTGHSTGGHQSSAWFNYRCDCDSGCRSTCQPTVTDNRCTEIGTIQGGMGTHKERTSTKVVPGSKPSPDFTGADCGAGWACYIQYCPANICSGFQISVSAQPLGAGVGITFSASSQSLWDGQFDFPFQCDGCGVGESGDSGGGAPYQIENQDPGWNTGSGGWMDSCYWRCTSTWNPGTPGDPNSAHYSEECILIC